MANFNLKNYNEVCVLKPVKSRAWLGISFVICFLVFTFLFSLILSPLLGLNYLGVLSNGTETYATSFYAVVINTNSTDSDYATEQAQAYRVRGGAGVLWENETYYVILSAYPSEDDAETVKEQITTTSLTPEIMEISINKTDTASFTTEEKELYNKSFEFLLSTLNSLYDISYKIDTGLMTELNANLQIKNLLLDTSYYYQQILANESDNLEDIKTILASTNSLLEYVADEEVLTSTALPYSGDIRRVLVRLLFVIYELE